MSLDASEIAAIVDVLSVELPGGRIRGVRGAAREPGAVVLEVRTAGANHALLLSAEPGAARLHRLRSVPAQPSEPAAFVMLLRKLLVGLGVRAVEQLGGDRVVRLTTAAPPDRADEPATELVAELTGRHGNLFLVRDGRIVGSLLPNKSRRRDLRPGASYVPPAPGPAPSGLRSGWPAQGTEAFVEATYDAALAANAHERERARQRAAVDASLKRARRALDAVTADLERIDGADTLRLRGELLRGAHGRVARGATSVRVQDWYAEGMPWVEVPLDPKLDLEANIQALFARYKRLQRGRHNAEAREAELREQVATLERLRARVDAATPEELEATADQLRGRRIPDAAARRQRAEAPRAPFHAYTSSDGLAILVGRGSADNDALTFRVARGNDIWMHAADFPGSHVVVRADRGRPVPARTLLEAAQLAAHFSKGRSDTTVAVTWTERKHVRKPRGAPAGRVTVAGGRTIEVRPDPAVVAALLATRA